MVLTKPEMNAIRERKILSISRNHIYLAKKNGGILRVLVARKFLNLSKI